MNKRLISLLAVFFIFLILPFQAVSSNPESSPEAYLNLGDSIAEGLSAYPGESYFDLYSKYLEDAYGVLSSTKITSLGLTSAGLLSGLETNTSLQYSVSQADVITISIGGNNLLGPIIVAVYRAYGLHPVTHTLDELFTGIINSGPEVWNQRISGLTQQAKDPGMLLGYSLRTGSQSFIQDWPRILDKIYDLNPHANVIVMTLSNPVSKSENPELQDLLEELIKPMNLALWQSQSGKCSVANVYHEFQNLSDYFNFRLLWKPNLNPHPTPLGHKVIFEELVKAGVSKPLGIEIRFYIDSNEYYFRETESADSQRLTMDTAPIIWESRTLLPIRYVANLLGASVEWEQTEQKVTIILGGRTIELWIGQNQARVNGITQYIDPVNNNVVPIIVYPGRTMLPLQFITDALGCQVRWDAGPGEVTVTYPAP